MLNDQAYWIASNGDGLGTYKCRLCGTVSEWHFGNIPGAMLIYSANTEVRDGGPLTHESPAAQSRRSLH
jgi:hypothetical protein